MYLTTMLNSYNAIVVTFSTQISEIKKVSEFGSIVRYLCDANYKKNFSSASGNSNDIYRCIKFEAVYNRKVTHFSCKWRHTFL